ncbi:hypothetical protein M0R45_015846 [Rubus argutus]|uniref:Protein kinase domain-containing protein n=1 Tax=Rubus argutus TaxID=59490 RepID=A0AAW1XRS2_RUBAR
MFRIESLLLASYTVSLLLSLSLPLSIRSQTHGASVECTPSCGNINIRSPFRLQGDPGDCGNKNYTLSCETNETSSQSHHAVLYLFSGKYYVQAINYNNYTIRLVDAGIHKIKDDYFSHPVHPLTAFNFSDSYSDDLYSIYFYSSDASSLRYQDLTVPLVFLSCTNPMKFSDLYVETAPCIGNHSSSDSSVSTVYSYFMLGGRLDEGYPADFMRPSDLEFSCKITLMVMVSPPSMDKNSKSCEGIYKKLAYGFELSWFQQECVGKCGPEDSCTLNRNNMTRVECHRQKADDLIYPILKMFHLDSWSAYTDLYKQPVVCAIIFGGIFLVAKLPFGIPFVTALLIYKWRRRHLSMYENIEDFLQSNNNLMPVRYSYSDIKKMASGFKDKLGEGGYGCVYKAKLRSGRFVAIKMLGNSKTNGQEFINEVATIGRIHHVNVVRLIGFCVDGSKRALVYDFMSNGSLEKYIFSQQGVISLRCEKIFEIAVGVARGIQYLHQGCDMQILHFDIKPHNILLDENFTAKVSDFGLARLYPLDNSIVSLTAARGTIGYIAPELFYKNIGGVSYKADVYSFGMLMLEMAGRRKNLNAAIGLEHSSQFSQIYFPTWVSDQLNQGKEIEIGDATEEEKKIIKKMIIVALWCIQMKPIERPSMSKVVEMLEGEIESLQIPPKPFLYPQQMPVDDAGDNSSTTSAPRMMESTEIINLSADEN